MAANHTIEMYITASTATDIYYLLRKYLRSTESSKMIMEKLYSLTGILDVTEDDCIDALAWLLHGRLLRAAKVVVSAGKGA